MGAGRAAVPSSAAQRRAAVEQQREGWQTTRRPGRAAASVGLTLQHDEQEREADDQDEGDQLEQDPRPDHGRDEIAAAHQCTVPRGTAAAKAGSRDET